MARRLQRQNKSPILEYRRLQTPELLKRYEHCLAGGDHRAVIDIAKECYRRDPGAASADRLAGAYMDRARGLMSKSLFTEAAAVLGNALALGRGSDELLRLAFECGLRSGQYGAAVSHFSRVRDPNQRTQALQMLIDEVVAHGDGLGRLCEPSIRDAAAAIRQAFAAYERGDDAAAAEALKPIGLHSPVSDWKWLVRGLIPYARDDAATAESCWTRAGAGGRAGRLAERLLALLPGQKAALDRLSPDARARLMTCFDNPRVGKLERIREALRLGRSIDALDLCAQLLALIPPEQRQAYAGRLQRSLCAELDWAQATHHRFLKVFGPVPEDPRLIRCCALACEHEDLTEAQSLWRYYLARLSEVDGIAPRLRERARALVWARLGDMAAQIPPPDSSPFFDGPRGEFDNEVRCFRTSLKSYPDDVRVHEKLLDALLRRKDSKSAERHAGEMLERWPDHVRCLTLLAEMTYERDAYRKALGYFARARQAEPLNADIRKSMQNCLIKSARRRIATGNWRLARTDFEQAESMRESNDQSTDLYCAWAAMEWQSGDDEQARVVYQRALAAGGDALLVEYALAVELDRAGVSGPIRDENETRLETAWTCPPNPATASALAALAGSLDVEQIQSERRELHRSNLLAYLGRAASESFSEAQLLTVCRFLNAGKYWAPLERFAQRGVDAHSGNYYFPLYVGRSLVGRKKKLPGKTIASLTQAGRQAAQAGVMDVAMELAGLLASTSMPPEMMWGMPRQLIDLIDDLMGEVPGGKRRRTDGPSLPMFVGLDDDDEEA